MRQPKFKNGDQVVCKESAEIHQPMTIIGRNLWCTDSNIILYLVKGKHIKKGNELIINLSEDILEGV
jgi:hypothetical protein